jgi:hypothetical protein
VETVGSIHVTTGGAAPTLERYPSDLVVEDDGKGNEQELREWLRTNGGARAVAAEAGVVSWSHSGVTLEAPHRYAAAVNNAAEDIATAESNQHTSEPNGITQQCGLDLFVTFTASDECGRSSYALAKIMVMDTEPPEVLDPPANLELEDDGRGNVDDIAAWLAAAQSNSASDGVGIPRAVDVAAFAWNTAANNHAIIDNRIVRSDQQELLKPCVQFCSFQVDRTCISLIQIVSNSTSFRPISRIPQSFFFFFYNAVFLLPT